MKRLFTIALTGFLLTSCASFQDAMNADQNMKKIAVGMTKERVISIMGKSYEPLGARGNETTLGYKTADNSTYILIFADDRLVEWSKELPLSATPAVPVYPGDPVNRRPNPPGVNISIKKDIFGNLVFNGENGKSATLKTDIFDSHIYTDSNGNKIEYGKDIWPGVMKQYRNDEQALFLHLIEKHLYGYPDYPPRRR